MSAEEVVREEPIYSEEAVAVEAPVEAKPEPPPKPTVISSEDRLKVENLDLKMKNIQLQLQIMQSELQKAMTLRGGYVKEMEDMRRHFIATYGADLASIKINDDGSFAPLQGVLPLPVK